MNPDARNMDGILSRLKRIDMHLFSSLCVTISYKFRLIDKSKKYYDKA